MTLWTKNFLLNREHAFSLIHNNFVWLDEIQTKKGTTWPLCEYFCPSSFLLSPSFSSSSDSAGKVLDFRRWRLHVINSNTQVISWFSYEVQNADIQLLHVSISTQTLMYTRVHMFQSTFTCYHSQLQSPHSCHKAPPTHLGVTLRPKKVTKWRRHTKREKPTKIHCTFN